MKVAEAGRTDLPPGLLPPRVRNVNSSKEWQIINTPLPLGWNNLTQLNVRGRECTVLPSSPQTLVKTGSAPLLVFKLFIEDLLCSRQCSMDLETV